jgi:hypothetical protein
MTRRLQVTLELEVEDLSDEERRVGIEDEDVDDPDMWPATVAELEANEIADLLPAVVTSPDSEMFAGSNVYASITKVDVVASIWVV